MGSIPGLERSPGEENGNLLQYSCLENSMDRGAWWAIAQWGSKELNTTEQLTHNNLFNRERESVSQKASFSIHIEAKIQWQSICSILTDQGRNPQITFR